MSKGHLGALGWKTSSIPKRVARKQLKELEEEKRVLIRKHNDVLNHLDWKINLQKEHISLPYKKHPWEITRR